MSSRAVRDRWCVGRRGDDRTPRRLDHRRHLRHGPDRARGARRRRAATRRSITRSSSSTACPPTRRTRTSTLLADRSDIRLFAVDDNLGFAGGNEYGVEQATGEYLCFLNPDLVVGPGWLEPLVAALDDPAVGIAAPVFLNADGSLQEAGQLIFSDTFTAPIGGVDVLTGDRSNIFSRDVDYASAACWLVRRADHDAIGGFDRHYHPAYFEDADYALRMEASGKRTRLVADVPVLHHHGLGSGTRDAAVGQATHARFKRRWADELADRPARPATAAEAIAARDRLAGTTTLFIVWSDHASDVRDRSRLRGGPRTRVGIAARPHHPADRHLAGTLRTRNEHARADWKWSSSDPSIVTRRSPLASRWPTRWWTSGHHRPIGVGCRRPRWSVAASVFVAGVVIRWVLFDSPAAVINADEAYSRIETYEILRGQFPMVLGGTVYTLPVEAYLYTPFTYLFSGANVVPLKLLSTLSWLGTAVTLFFIGRRLISDRAGLIAAALCWITPGALMVLSITAYPAYASGMFVVTLAFLVAITIVDAAPPRPSRRRMLLFGALGGVRVLAPPDVPHGDGADGCVRALGCAPPTRCRAQCARRRGHRLPPVPALERRQRLAVARIARRGARHLHRTAAHVLRRSPAAGVRAAQLQPRAGTTSSGGRCCTRALLATIALGLWAIARHCTGRGRVVLFVVLGSVFFLMAFLQNLIYANDGRYAMISLPFVLVALAAGIDQLGRSAPAVASDRRAGTGCRDLDRRFLPTRPTSVTSTPAASTRMRNSTTSSTCSTSAGSTGCTAATGRCCRSISPATTAS